MRGRVLRVFCLVMVMIMLVSSPVAFADEQTEAAPADFVILLDCSWSLNVNDPKNLCVHACKNFIDKLPAQDARVSVISFGYLDENTKFAFSDRFEVDTPDTKYIHEIIPLGSKSSTEDKQSYKNIVEETFVVNTKDKQSYTPIGHALAAAVEMLERGKSADSNACIILVSDGVMDSPTMNVSRNKALAEEASMAAGAHGWPIYSIGVNYNNGNLAEITQAKQLLDGICSASGDRQVGNISCETPRDVHVAFKQIFDDFYGRNSDQVEEMNLPGEYYFEIPNLTSEASIDIFGDSVEYVDLINVDEGTTRKISASIEEAGLITAVEPDVYYSIKLICPKAGKWAVKIHGDEDATVLVSNSTLQELGLKMVANATGTPTGLTKNDTISVAACFSYHGTEIHNNPFYAENEASVRVTSAKGITKEFPMEADSDGYSCRVPVSSIPSGDFEVQVVLRHTMFRNGVKISNSETFSAKNLPPEDLKAGPIKLKAYVNGETDPIDLGRLFQNPDGDTIEYSLTCTSDRTAQFESRVEADYMTIKTCLLPGSYQMQITAKDEDMSSPLVYDGLTLEVSNREVSHNNLRNVELWTDKYAFQDRAVGAVTVDMNEYFSDPDGVELQYSVEGTGEGIVGLSQNGGLLTLSPIAEGETRFSVTASDGVSSASDDLKVTVISGKAAFWRDNWIFFAIAAIILLILILILITLLKNKKVKGYWTISVQINGALYSVNNFNITHNTGVGKKGKFTLKALLNDLAPYLGITGWASVSPDYFPENSNVSKICFVGVIRKAGCTVTHLPKEGVDGFSATCSGIPGKGKLSVRAGDTLQFQLPNTSPTGGADLVVTLSME